MRRYLYDDFYEGLLHILVLSLPIFVGILQPILIGDVDVIPISLLVAIASALYASRNLYKDHAYSDNRRVKILLILNMILLAVAIAFTIHGFQMRVVADANSNSDLPDYTIPVFIYFISEMPFLIEIVCVMLHDLNFGFKIGKSNKRSGGDFDFDVTPAAIN